MNHVYNDLITFADLNNESQSKILETLILFQGNEVKLKTILSDVSLIDSDTLVQLIKNDKIAIGSKLEIFDDYNPLYYINRYFCYHYPEFDISTRQAPLIEIDFVKHQYEVDSSNLILLSDYSGNGKSTVLYHLYELIKNLYPNHLVFLIRLNNFTKILKTELNKMPNDRSKDWAIDFLLKMLQSVHSYTQFEINFIKFSFNYSNKITLFLDGFDEICPDYESLITSLVIGLRKTKIAKIWLTTRSTMKKSLKETFQVFAVSLQPLSSDNQIEFLTKFLCHELNSLTINSERLETYAKALIEKFVSSISDRKTFMGTPLQLKMLGSVFQQNSSDEKWQGCKEFLTSTSDAPIFPKKLKLNEVYEKFITKKCKIYSDEKGTTSTGNVASKNENLFYINCALKVHEEVAFQILFSDDKIHWLSCPYSKFVSLLESIEKMGIVQKINNNFHFVHATFPEYLVANFLATNLNEKHIDNNALKFLFEEILLQRHKVGVRTFFSGFLSTMSIQEEISKACGIMLSDILNGTDADHLLTNCSLHLACLENNASIIYFIVKSLIANTDRNAELLPSLIEAKNHSGETVLFEAAELNDLNLITFLISDAQANVETTNNKGRTALMNSVIYGHSLEVIQLLAVNVNAIDTENESVLFKAVEQGNAEVVSFLLNEGALVNFVADYGITVLHNAIHSGSLAVVQCLVEHGASVNVSDDDGISVLHYAAYSGNLEICKWLIDKNGGSADVHCKSKDGSTILHEAAISGNLTLCQWLVKDLCLDYTCKDYNRRTVLHEACKYNNFEVAQWLVTLPNSDINCVDSNGHTLLMDAAKYGDSKLCTFLIDLGLKTDLTDERGRTLLFMAIEYGNLEVLQWLTSGDVVYDAEIEISNMIGDDLFLPLHSFSADHEMKWMLVKNSIVSKRICPDGIERIKGTQHRNDNEEIVHHLFENGANINVQNSSGQTIFHCAISLGRIDLARKLLEKRGESADFTLQDKNDKTALDVAKESEETYLVNQLETLQIK